jgi:hypothetical protein
MLIGFAVAGWITDNKMADIVAVNWQMVWIISMLGIAIVVFHFYFYFNEKQSRRNFFYINK